MNKNPVVPYAIIAVIGVLAVIIISYVGVNQREAIENPDEANGETEETTANPDEIFQNNCASCHGDDLSGDSAPDLTKVGSEHSEEEIQEIINEGTDGGMPGGLVDNEQAALIAEWLAEMK